MIDIEFRWLVDDRLGDVNTVLQFRKLRKIKEETLFESGYRYVEVEDWTEWTEVPFVTVPRE